MHQLNVALKAAIWQRRKSQVAIRHETGISEWRLSRIINGHTRPTADEKKAIAKILKRPVAELFPNEEAVA